MSRTNKVFALSLSRGGGGILGFAILALAARQLSLTEFASFQQTLICYTLMLPVLQFGMGQGIYYILPGEQNRPRGRVVDLILTLAASGCLYAAFLVLGGNHLVAAQFNNPDLARLIPLLVPALIFSLPASQAVSVLIASNNVFLASGWNLLHQTILASVTLAAIFVFGTAFASIVGYSSALLATSVPAIFLMVRACPAGKSRPSLQGMRELIVFSMPLGIASMVGTIGMQIDRVLISSYFPPETFALYAVAAFEIPVIFIITSSITSVILAEMTTHFRSGKSELALELWKSACRQSALVLFPTAVFFLFFSNHIVTLVFSDRFAESIQIFRIYLLLIPLRIFIFGSILTSAGESRFILTRTLLWAAVNIIVSILLIRLIGLYGAAIGTVISQYFFAAPLNFLKLRQITGCRITQLAEWKELLKCFIIALAPLPITLAGSFLFEDPIWKMSAGALLYGLQLLILYRLTNNLPAPVLCLIKKCRLI